tara:strand:+ start:1327 stop:2121 length:795 start_codon:yes stop_codon:yes gene_type:complete
MKEEITTKEREMFSLLAKKYNWDLSVFNLNNLKNPNNLSLSNEVPEIDKYLMKFVSSGKTNKVWRRKTWHQNLQNWFQTTERFNLSKEELLTPIDFGESVKDEGPKTIKRTFTHTCIEEKYGKGLSFSYRENWAKYAAILKKDVPEKYTKKINGRFCLGNATNTDLPVILEKKLIDIFASIETIDEKKQFAKYLLHVGAWDAFLIFASMVENDFIPRFDHTPKEEEIIDRDLNPLHPDFLKYDPDNLVPLAELRDLLRKHRGIT